MKKLLFGSALFSLCLTALPVHSPAKSDQPPTRAIRVTPPAPAFTDAERQTELARRRREIGRRMEDESVLVMFGAEPKIYAGDVDFMYRQENNLYYLTNLKQNGATLVMTKSGGAVQEFLFLPKRNPAFETWNGKMYSNEDAARISGIKTVVGAEETPAFLQALKDKKAFASADGAAISAAAAAKNLYLILPDSDGDGDGKREYDQEMKFAAALGKVTVGDKKQFQYEAANGVKILNAAPFFAELRLIKSPYEIKLVQHAIDITTEAQSRAMGTVGRAKYEYETQAEVEYIFRKRNADYWGYPSIVGCGPNATTLHYIESQGAIKPGELMLMDVGAEYDHYTADVTRTYPVNGKFSPEQAEIYQIVYDAQEAAAAKIKPGATFDEADNASDEVIKKGLAKLGLITAPDATYEILYRGKPVKLPQYRLWFMHGWGHWLGMNVHDVGSYQTPFQEGMITTNEPGIYVREDTLGYIPETPENKEFLAKIRPAFEKYKNIGVRIEDDMLVTKTGVEWMTKNLPRKIADIERLMAQAAKETAAYVPAQTAAPRFAALDLDANLFVAEQTSANTILSGATVRRGWIHTGKNAAASGALLKAD